MLDRGQPVDIALDGGWHLTARVSGIGEDFIALGPVEGELRLPGALSWCGATISWRTRLGAAHRQGMLFADSADELRLHPFGEAVKIQRRRFVRVSAELSTALIAQDRRLLTRTLDVSVGGMLVSPADTLALDEQVRFALDLGDLTISGDGVIVRGTPDGARGVRFSDLHGGAERALSRYVAHRQRQLIVG